jgi:hypothetical protein
MANNKPRLSDAELRCIIELGPRAEHVLRRAVEAISEYGPAHGATRCLAALSLLDAVVDEMRTLLSAEVAEMQAASAMEAADALERSVGP